VRILFISRQLRHLLLLRWELVQFLYSSPQFQWLLFVASFTHRLEVELVKLGFLIHFVVTNRASEMVDAPRFVQRCENVSFDHLVAGITKIPKQLMVMCFAVGESFLLVMFVSHEGLFAFGAYEMLDMEVFPQSCDYPLLDGSSASATNGDSHFVVTAQAVEIAFNLTRVGRQLDAASGAVKVISMIRLVPPLQRLVVDDALAFIANVFANGCRLLAVIALVTQSAVGFFDEPTVR